MWTPPDPRTVREIQREPRVGLGSRVRRLLLTGIAVFVGAGAYQVHASNSFAAALQDRAPLCSDGSRARANDNCVRFGDDDWLCAPGTQVR